MKGISMRYCTTIILFILAASLCGLGSEYFGAKSVRINTGDTLNTDLLAGSRYIDIDGYLKGDLYAGGEKIAIEGKVTDDVLAGARDLSIRGEVGDMVIGFGQYILLDGEVGGDVIAFGAEVRITNRAHIKGNLYVGTGNFRMEGGQIDGWVRGGAKNIMLNGIIKKEVNLEGDDVTFGENYEAGGGTKLKLAHGLDPEKAGEIPTNLELTFKKKHPFYTSFGFYWSFFALLVTGILLSLIFKSFVGNVIAVARENLLKNMGIGLLLLIVIPLAIILLLILVFTIPVALIILVLYLIMIYLSSIFTGILLGDYLLSLMRGEKTQANFIWSLIIGLVVITLFVMIPYLGFIIKLAVISLGFGSLMIYLWSLRKMKVMGT